jgi:uncharacterized protein (DUF2147 family)
MLLKKELALIICLLMLQLAALCQAKADGIMGYWQTRSKNPAKIQIYKTGDRYNGKIVWLKVRGYIGVSLLGRTEYWTRTTL